MNCDEVIRELSVPTDDRDPAALAGHLANCPSCACWSKRDAEFRHLWDATRPVNPPPQIWDAMWSQISSSLDSTTPAADREFRPSTVSLNGSLSSPEGRFGLSPTSSRSRSQNWRVIGLIGLAQAAAVFLAVVWGWHTSSKSRMAPIAVTNHLRNSLPEALQVASKKEGLATASVDIEPGRWVVIRVEDSTVNVVDLTPEGMSSSVDDWLLAFNAAEAIANPVVAMKE